MSAVPVASGELPLVALRRVVLDAPADTAAEILASEIGRMIGAASVQVRLCDRALHALHVVAAAGLPDGAGDGESWPVTGTAAGDALLTRRIRRQECRGLVRAHVPLAVRGDARGVLSVDEPAAGVADAVLHDVAEFVALLVAQAGEVTDHFEVHRRSWSFSVSAELQWQLLPATSVDEGRVEVHALVDPAPRVSSDLFDWSIDRGRVHLAVLDAEGRSLSATLPAALAVAALRHARRADLPLGEQVALVDQAVYGQYRGDVAVRALVVGVDLDTGEVEAVRAGEPGPAPRAFRRRDGRVEELGFDEQEALGRFDRSSYTAQAVDLRAGDELFVVSDGGHGCRDGSGAAFGSDALLRHLAGGLDPLSGTPRRLLDLMREHSGGELAQDATVLALGWRPTA